MNIWIRITMALWLGCASSHVGRAGADAGGEETMTLRQAWWQTPTRLGLTVEVAGAGSVEPERFRLATLDGRWHEAERDVGIGGCRGLLESGTRRCVVAFSLDAPPSRLRFIASAGDLEVDIEPCAPISPFGLCPHDEVCLAGACEPLCGPAHPDGHCVDDGRACVAGHCE